MNETREQIARKAYDNWRWNPRSKRELDLIAEHHGCSQEADFYAGFTACAEFIAEALGWPKEGGDVEQRNA